MAAGTGYFDPRGIWQYGEDDQSPTFSDMLNLGQKSISEAIANISASGAAMRQTIIVDDYAQPGDSADHQAWQRAVNAAVAAGKPTRLLATRSEYLIGDPIIINGLSRVLIEGAGGFGLGTVFKAKPGSRFGAVETRAIVFRRNNQDTKAVSGITFRNLTFDGGMAAEPTGMARDTRPYDSEWIATAVRLDGPIPSSPNTKAIGEVEFDKCRFIGLYDLPILINGVSNVTVRDAYLRRCKDPGFTFCRAVRFLDSRVEFSADNGVSVSRGCSEIVISGNTITDSFYAGIHIGGFSGDAGPEVLVVTGNTVLRSRQFGISAITGARSVVITGNMVRSVQRGAETTNGPEVMGDTNGVSFGSGIIVGGLHVGDPTVITNYTSVCSQVTISGNTVEDAERFGICLWKGLRNVTVTGNTVTNPGSTNHVNGDPVSSTHNYYNIGIGYYTPYSSTIQNVTIAANTIVEDRAEPRMNYGVYPFAGGAMAAVNTIVGARSQGLAVGPQAAFRKSVTVGLPTEADTSVRVRGSGGATRAVTYATGDSDKWHLRMLASGALEVFHVDSNKRLIAFDTTGTGIYIPHAAIGTVSGVTPNLYLTSTGELRRIVAA